MNMNIIPVTPFNMNTLTINLIRKVFINDKGSKVMEYTGYIFGIELKANSPTAICQKLVKKLTETFRYELTDFRLVLFDARPDIHVIKKAYVINPMKLTTINYIFATQIDQIDIQFLKSINSQDTNSFTYDYSTGVIRDIIVKCGDNDEV